MDNRTKIFIYSLIGFCINLSYVAGNLFISNFSDSLGASKSFIGVINAILPFFSIISAPLFARRAAKIQKKLPIIRIGFIIGVIFSMMLFFANDKFLILFLRMGMGVSFGATTALTNSLATEIDTKKRGKYFGIYSGACSLGWGIGALLVGFIVIHRYNNSFLLSIISLIVGLILTFFAKEKYTSSGYFGIDFETFKKFFPYYKTLLLRHSVATALWAFLPVYLEFSLEFSRFTIAIIYFINNSLQLLTMALAGYLSDRVKRKYIVLSGMMGSITFFTAFTIVKLPIEFMLLQILVAFSWAFVYMGISSLVADSSTWNERGEAMAGLSMTLNLSNILGPLLGGIIYGLSDYPTMILVLLPLCLLAIISSIMLKEKEHISHNIYK